MNLPHEYQPGHTGRTCDALYLDDEGYGDVCGLGVESPVHVADLERFREVIRSLWFGVR